MIFSVPEPEGVVLFRQSKVSRHNRKPELGVCVANFVPNCIFKPVEPGDVIPQVLFPFARFANGENSVEVKFSINGSESNVNIRKWDYDFMHMEWNESQIELRSDVLSRLH
nr:hypothetical transcript [Hymenolepis microstoma]